MTEGLPEKNIFQELESHNPSVAQAFRGFRMRRIASESLTDSRGAAPRSSRRLLWERSFLPSDRVPLGEARSIPQASVPMPAAMAPASRANVWPLVAAVLLLIGLIAITIVSFHAILWQL
ncbi:MAG TPA: hypothetical protein VF713_10280, partial [Thermoanaerobaculia bacterium]